MDSNGSEMPVPLAQMPEVEASLHLLKSEKFNPFLGEFLVGSVSDVKVFDALPSSMEMPEINVDDKNSHVENLRCLQDGFSNPKPFGDEGHEQLQCSAGPYWPDALTQDQFHQLALPATEQAAKTDTMINGVHAACTTGATSSSKAPAQLQPTPLQRPRPPVAPGVHLRYSPLPQESQGPMAAKPSQAAPGQMPNAPQLQRMQHHHGQQDRLLNPRHPGTHGSTHLMPGDATG